MQVRPIGRAEYRVRSGMTDILVFRPGALGDTIVVADALRALGHRFPGHGIELVGNQPAAALLVSAGLAARATSFDGPEAAALFGNPPRVAERWRGKTAVVVWLADPAPLAEVFLRDG